MMHFLKNSQLSRILLPLTTPLLLVLFWFVLNHYNLVGTIYLPDLFLTLSAVKIFFMTDGFLHIWYTLWRTFLGFFLAGVLGVPCGLIIGFVRELYSSTEILIDFFRSLPVTALLPLFLLIFGTDDVFKIAVIAFVAFWVILVNSIHGVWNVSQTRIKAAKVFRATNAQLLSQVVFFEALPQIFVGSRIALSLSLVIAIVIETFVGAKYGIGKVLYDNYVTFRTPQLYAIILVTGLLGYLINRISVAIETNLIHWIKKEL